MKKNFGSIMGVIGAIIIGVGIIFKVNNNTSDSIIGGADGPTSIFLVGDQSSITMIIGLIVLVMGVVISLIRRK